MLDITFDVSVLVINKADIIYQAFNASSENEIPVAKRFYIPGESQRYILVLLI
jgi:hypothetical protein